MNEERPVQSLRRWMTVLIPAAFSLALSLRTMGANVFWQDSGLYLAAVKDVGILYPPGFVPYLVLCKLWTLLFSFVDFTRAVHLFSAACTALAAVVLAAAARDLLLARSRLFRITEESSEARAEMAGALTGCFWAAGYTVGANAIYAKGYALYYLALALLLRRIIRAEERQDPREHTIVAALIGILWSLHPSAALLAPVLIAFAWRARSVVGTRGLWWRAGLALVCAVGPSLLLPLLARRENTLALGHPVTMAEWLRYLFGSRFIGAEGTWGFARSRVLSFPLFLWEELLGVGLAFVSLGLFVLERRNRALLGAIMLWVVPYSLITILFKMEGQHDSWFVAAWMPLYLAMAVGIHAVTSSASVLLRRFVPVAAAAGIVWAVVVNVPLLDQRHYDLAELFGRAYLEPLDRNALLLLNKDDAGSTVEYLQKIRGLRPDVLTLAAPFLNEASYGYQDWYEERHLKRHPELRAPDYASMREKLPSASVEATATAAFLNANAEGTRPLFTQGRPADILIRPDFVLVPAGALWKLVPKARGEVDLSYWKFPMEPESVMPRYRRARGQWSQLTATGLFVRPQCYEERMVLLVAKARKNLGLWWLERGEVARAIPLLESVLTIDPMAPEDPFLLFSLANARLAMSQEDEAAALFRKVLDREAEPMMRASTLACLGEIARGHGRTAEAEQRFQEALTVPGLTPAQREMIG